MRIRCGACHGSIWIQTTNATGEQAVASCGDCPQTYDLRAKLSEVDLYDFQRDAHAFARNAGIDLPAAYSILLGITTLEKIRDFCEQRSAPRPAKFDPSFSDAVSAGILTPQQAASRGKRDVFARKLVARHQISLKEAFEVADNRTPLLAAVRREPEVERVETATGRRRIPIFGIALTVGAILAVVTAIVFTGDSDQATQATRRKTAPKPRRVIASLQEVATDVVYDAAGRATEITGGNPEAVLQAYCRSVKGFKAEPVSLQAAGDDWNGLYRSRGVLYSIPIRWDRGRGLWVAGNAADWIHGEPVPSQ